jgi:hypothetical protein
MGILALIAGLLLSGTAAYYSIVGLMAIFPGSTMAIVAMGASLEFAKLVVASWLYRNWKIAPTFLKGVFSAGVLILMFFTSMGIFGFLSKSHLEHTASMGADTTYQLVSAEQKVTSKEKTVKLLERQIDSIDNSMASYIEQGKITTGLQQRNRLKADRAALEKQRQEAEAELIELNTNLNVLRTANAKREVEVGPLKYIAEMIYGDKAQDHFDSAVRAVIIIIVAVFDPLAVLLLIAANMSFSQSNKPIEPVVEVKITKPIDPNKPPPKKRGRKKKVDKERELAYNSGSENIYEMKDKEDFGIEATEKPDQQPPKVFDSGAF